MRYRRRRCRLHARRAGKKKNHSRKALRKRLLRRQQRERKAAALAVAAASALARTRPFPASALVWVSAPNVGKSRFADLFWQ